MIAITLIFNQTYINICVVHAMFVIVKKIKYYLTGFDSLCSIKIALVTLYFFWLLTVRIPNNLWPKKLSIS